jgi:hypothetical protein
VRQRVGGGIWGRGETASIDREENP